MTNRTILSKLHDVFSEVFDEGLCSTLHHLMAFNSFLLSERYGFRKEMSTENTALKITNVVFLCSNQNMMYAFFCVITGI
jgi:hypothetical protein